MTAEHIAFLCDPKVLVDWASRSLKERAVLIHRRWPDLHISPSKLANVYKSNGIKRKVIILKKVIKHNNQEKWLQQAMQMKQEILSAELQSKKIIFVDESMFTISTLPRLAYSKPNKNIEIAEKLASSPALAVVAGIS